MTRIWKECFSELVGTFILVFIGCSSVGMAVVLGWLDELWQVALIWGVGVTMAIMVAQRWGPAHLNPAVSLAMCIARHHSWRRLLPYSLAQLLGAVLAAESLYLIFENAIDDKERALLGSDSDLYPFVGPMRSQETAQMFGEFYPNLGYAHLFDLHWTMAFFAELSGTFILLYFILKITHHIDRITWLVAGKIGLVVTLLISVIAPLTQCGINPARDLGPRMIAFVNGWGSAALPADPHAALTVYVIGPLAGAAIVSMLWRYQSKH